MIHLSNELFFATAAGLLSIRKFFFRCYWFSVSWHFSSLRTRMFLLGFAEHKNTRKIKKKAEKWVKWRTSTIVDLKLVESAIRYREIQHISSTNTIIIIVGPAIINKFFWEFPWVEKKIACGVSFSFIREYLIVCTRFVIEGKIMLISEETSSNALKL